MSDNPTSDDQWREDQKASKAKGMMIVGFPRQCACGGRAYGSPKPDWQNRVVCLTCGRKWSQ